MAKIIADSSCDMYTRSDIHFESVPLLIYTDKDSFLDDGSINIKNMLDTLESHKGRSYRNGGRTKQCAASFNVLRLAAHSSFTTVFYPFCIALP